MHTKWVVYVSWNAIMKVKIIRNKAKFLTIAVSFTITLVVE